MLRPAWFMSPRSIEFMAYLRDANGSKIFPGIEERNRLRMASIHATTSIPDTLGSGGNESEMYLVDMAQIIVGMATEI